MERKSFEIKDGQVRRKHLKAQSELREVEELFDSGIKKSPLGNERDPVLDFVIHFKVARFRRPRLTSALFEGQ
jgi:hypothetical protein